MRMFQPNAINYRNLVFWEHQSDTTVENILQYFLSESDQDSALIVELSENMKFYQLSKLFRRVLDSIRHKSDIIDFRDIDRSKGDIEKVEGYKTFNTALKKLRTSNSRKDSILFEIEKLRDYIIEYRPYFKKAYAESSFTGRCFYRSCVFTFFYSIAVYLSSCIQVEIPKTPEAGKVKLTFRDEKELKKTFVFQSLIKLNKYFKEGKVKEFLKKGDLAVDNGKALIESVQKTHSLKEDVSVAAIIIGIPIAIFGIIFLIREIIFYFFKFRKYLASEFAIAAEYLELNAELQSDSKTRKKQIEMAKRYAKIADAINVKSERTTKQVEKEIKKELIEDKKVQSQKETPKERETTTDNDDASYSDKYSGTAVNAPLF